MTATTFDGSSPKALTIKVTPDDTVNPDDWPAVFAGDGFANSNAIAVDPDGFVVITGKARTSSRQYVQDNMVTIRYESDGDIASGWPKFFALADGSPKSAEGLDVAVDENNQVFVSGKAVLTAAFLMVAVSYDEDGLRIVRASMDVNAVIVSLPDFDDCVFGRLAMVVEDSSMKLRDLTRGLGSVSDHEQIAVRVQRQFVGIKRSLRLSRCLHELIPILAALDETELLFVKALSNGNENAPTVSPARNLRRVKRGV